MKKLLVKVRITNIHDFTNVITLGITEVGYYKFPTRKVLHEIMKRIRKREKKKNNHCLGIFVFIRILFFPFHSLQGGKFQIHLHIHCPLPERAAAGFHGVQLKGLLRSPSLS